jgi:hypothetical protein
MGTNGTTFFKYKIWMIMIFIPSYIFEKGANFFVLFANIVCLIMYWIVHFLKHDDNYNNVTLLF